MCVVLLWVIVCHTTRWVLVFVVFWVCVFCVFVFLINWGHFLQLFTTILSFSVLFKKGVWVFNVWVTIYPLCGSIVAKHDFSTLFYDLRVKSVKKTFPCNVLMLENSIFQLNYDLLVFQCWTKDAWETYKSSLKKCEIGSWRIGTRHTQNNDFRVKWSKNRLLASRFWRSWGWSRGLMLYSGNISCVLGVSEVLRMEQLVNAVFREHFMCVGVFGILGSGFGQKWSKSLAKSHYFGCMRHCRTQKSDFWPFLTKTQILGSQTPQHTWNVPWIQH